MLTKDIVIGILLFIAYTYGTMMLGYFFGVISGEKHGQRVGFRKGYSARKYLEYARGYGMGKTRIRQTRKEQRDNAVAH